MEYKNLTCSDWLLNMIAKISADNQSPKKATVYIAVFIFLRMSDFAIGSWNQNDPEGRKTVETTMDNPSNENPRRLKLSKLDVHSKSRQIIRYDTAWKPKNPKAVPERKFAGTTIMITANKLGRSRFRMHARMSQLVINYNSWTFMIWVIKSKCATKWSNHISIADHGHLVAQPYSWHIELFNYDFLAKDSWKGAIETLVLAAGNDSENQRVFGWLILFYFSITNIIIDNWTI